MTSPLNGKVAPFGNAVDTFHRFLHEPAGDIDTEAGSMPNLRKLSNELRDIAASTAENTAGDKVLAIEDRLYPGVYSTPPTHKPHSGEPSAEGDRCVILVGATPTEHLRSGGGWLIPNFDAQLLAQAESVPMMDFTAVEAQSIFDNALPKTDYAELRDYSGRARSVRITGVMGTTKPAGICGIFVRTSDETSADNGGTIIVDAIGRRWKRVFDGDVYASWFGIIYDWNSATGTDQVAVIQAAVDSFGGARGVLLFSSGRVRADSGRINFKKVVFKGPSTTDNAATGGLELYFGELGGLYTTIEDNNGPRHENLRLTSSSTRMANGQVLLDLTGINYPALQNITTYGGQVAIKLSAGAVVESHYGTFINVNIGRAYHGVYVAGGNRTQSHQFEGGRVWDCVVGCVNAEGTSDIKFFGTSFESDMAVLHLNAGANPNAAETKMFGCRDECNLAPDIAVGMLVQDGVYWSGYKKPREFSVSGGQVVWKGRTLTSNVRGDMAPIGENLLRNPELEADVFTGAILGWTPPSGATFNELNGPRGRLWSWTRANAFQAWEQNGINLKKGRYIVGFVVDKENSTSSGAILLQMTDSAGALLVAGADVDVDFSSSNFAAIAGGHLGSAVVKEFEVLRDLTNVRFRGGINSMPAGQIGYFGSPFLINGRNADKYSNPLKAPAQVVYGAAPPTTGTYGEGATCINPKPSQVSPVERWRCITAGTPGTWRAASWIVGKGGTAQRPTLAASDIGVMYLDTTLNANGKPIFGAGAGVWVDANGALS